ncbi:MAG: hypothetical protein R6V03_09055 [Kiritimatiellia bacterium]
MKRRFLWIAITWVSLALNADADNIKSFIEDVNTAWGKRQYSIVLSNINARLQGNSNDVLALSMKMYYHVLVEPSPASVRTAAAAFTNVVHSSGRYDMEPWACDMADKFLSFPLTETNKFTQEQRARFHEAMPEFPGIAECVSFAIRFSQTNSTVFLLDVESSNPSSGVAITIEPRDNAARGGQKQVSAEFTQKIHL